MDRLLKFFLLVLVSTPVSGLSKNKYDNGFPEEKYHEILDIFQDHYGQLIKGLGGELLIERDWSDGAVNMWAEKWGDQYILEIPGGMVRYHLIIEEAFVLSICHELGHLLGGAPSDGPISYEGQSDYYASKDCIRNMLTLIEPFAPVAPTVAVDQLCGAQSGLDQKLCQRSMMGAESLTSYYAEILGQDFPEVSKKSSKVVLKTLKGHPEPQCRLDTFVAGYWNLPRPACWYRE